MLSESKSIQPRAHSRMRTDLCRLTDKVTDDVTDRVTNYRRSCSCSRESESRKRSCQAIKVLGERRHAEINAFRSTYLFGIGKQSRQPSVTQTSRNAESVFVANWSGNEGALCLREQSAPSLFRSGSRRPHARPLAEPVRLRRYACCGSLATIRSEAVSSSNCNQGRKWATAL